jgi:hypothetical protein
MRYKSTVVEPSTPDLTGQPFERLVVIRFAGYVVYGNGSRHAYWTCQCVCGRTKDVLAGNLLSHNTRSCACLRQETMQHQRTTHGKTHTPEYRVWQHILSRCDNPADAAYDRYGGRGITVCEPWHDFATFYQDMGPRPSPRHRIGRRDTSGPYSPHNAYWAPATDYNRHTRTNRLLTLCGVTKCVAEWAAITGLSSATIVYRKNSHWSDERALTTPSWTVPVIVFPPEVFNEPHGSST